MQKVFIKTEGLCYQYEDDLSASPALNDLSVEIYDGEFVAVLGHNGSGKSTLAKLLNMILVPSCGKIYIDGKDITDEGMTDKDLMDLRKKVGMVFQNPDNQLVATRVEDDVAFGPENLGVPSAEIRRRVDEALGYVGMSAYAKHEPHRLSGGQKQRVAIAGIIAMMPKCIIFDESTAMLDPVGRRDVMNTIIKLNKEKNITVVMITHYMEEAALADRIIVLNDGSKLMEGTPEEVFERESELVECGLSVPQCTELVNLLESDGFEISNKRVTVEECTEIVAQLLNKGKTNV